MTKADAAVDPRTEHRYAISYVRARAALAIQALHAGADLPGALHSGAAESTEAGESSEPQKLYSWEEEGQVREQVLNLAGNSEQEEAEHKKAAKRVLQLLDRVGRIRQLYLTAHESMLRALVHKYSSYGADREDLYQEASLGLLRAMDRFDWHRGVRFSTYAQYWVKERILAFLYGQNKTIRLPAWVQKLWGKVHALTTERGRQPEVAELSKELCVSERRVRRVLDSRKTVSSLAIGQDESEIEIADERFRPESEIDEKNEVLSVLGEAMEGLNAREREVVTRRFGLFGRVPEGLAEIAHDFGVSSERIRQIQHAALARLKGHSRLDQFAGCLA